jgi:hypothetical protein
MLKWMVCGGSNDGSELPSRMSPGIKYILGMLSTINSTGKPIMMPQFRQVMLNSTRLVALFCLRRHLLFNKSVSDLGGNTDSIILQQSYSSLLLSSGCVRPEVSAALQSSIDPVSSSAVSPAANESIVDTDSEKSNTAELNTADHAAPGDGVKSHGLANENFPTMSPNPTVHDLSSPSDGNCLPIVTQISGRIDNDLSKVIQYEDVGFSTTPLC